jgi:hypothetical protein
MRRIAALACMSFIVMAACDQTEPTETLNTPRTQAVMLDGTTGGNSHFYFLGPLVRPPASFPGTFNPDLTPTVEVCRNSIAQDAAGHCTSLLVKYDRFTPAGGGQLVQVSTSEQAYAVEFRAKDFPIERNVPFRVVVLIGDVQLGFFDIVKTSTGYRNATDNDLMNRTGIFPIRFRIEDGALCVNPDDCFEGQVGPAGGTFTVQKDDGTVPAGTEFPSGALNQNVTLIIERITGIECLPTDAPQYRGCFRFRTEPHVANFNLPATIGICMEEAAGVPFFNDGQLRLWKWSEVNGDPIQELERVTIDYLNCPTPTALGARPTSSLLLGATRAGSWLLKPLAAVFGPSEAYADVIGYEGGKLGNFSIIGWVRPLAVKITAGDNQNGQVGRQVATQPQVRIVNRYGLTEMGVAGRIVDFTPSGNGLANPPSTFSDAQGFASTQWELATTPGFNTLLVRTPTSRVIAPTPYQADATFTANGQ